MCGCLGLRSGCREVTLSCSGGGRRQSVWVPGVHLGSRALCSPEEQEAVLEGSRRDCWSPSSGACGTFPAALAGYALQDPEDDRSPRPKADKRLGSCWGSRSCLSGWSWSTGGQGTPRGFSKAQVLLAARPGTEMPRSGPAIFHLGYTRHKMWQSPTPPSLVGNGLLPRPRPHMWELPLHFGGSTGPQTHPHSPVSGFLGLTSVHWIVCETAELPTAKQMD